MRKIFIAGNWKMHLDLDEAINLVNGLLSKGINFDKVDAAVCPSFVFLSEISRLIKDSKLEMGAQNVYFEEKGAFTGEVSPIMLKSVGCKYVIIGHSERRHIMGESSLIVNKKLLKTMESGLIPILCVGETLDQREKGDLFNVVEQQLTIGLEGTKISDGNELVIAYEPVWAIGTGVNATPEQAQEMHDFIRNKILAGLFGRNISEQIRILYGGSVKPENSADILVQPDIDGALVGGASLKTDSFYGIIKSAY